MNLPSSTEYMTIEEMERLPVKKFMLCVPVDQGITMGVLVDIELLKDTIRMYRNCWKRDVLAAILTSQDDHHTIIQFVKK